MISLMEKSKVYTLASKYLGIKERFYQLMSQNFVLGSSSYNVLR